MDDLREEITRKLSDLGADGDEQTVKMSDLMSRLNRNRSKQQHISKQELERVLRELELANRLMFVLVGDDPMIMLI